MYSPDYLAAVHAKRRDEQPAEPKRKAEDKLWYFLSGELGSAYAAEAERRGVRPNVLIGALLRQVEQGGLIDAVLDGENPNDIAPGHAKRLDGLTRLQSGALYLLALNADLDGIARVAGPRLAELLSTGTGSISAIREALVVRGYIERVEEGRPQGTRTTAAYRLTDDGWAVARALGGCGVDANGGKA